jgi:hypothetical protein
MDADGGSLEVLEAWISAPVGGAWTGPTRAPNRRLPAACAANPHSGDLTSDDRC